MFKVQLNKLEQCWSRPRTTGVYSANRRKIGYEIFEQVAPWKVAMLPPPIKLSLYLFKCFIIYYYEYWIDTFFSQFNFSFLSISLKNTLTKVKYLINVCFMSSRFIGRSILSDFFQHLFKRDYILIYYNSHNKSLNRHSQFSPWNILYRILLLYNRVSQPFLCHVPPKPF